MNDIALRVEGLGKRYRIGRKQERYKTLRDSLMDGLSSSFRRMRSFVEPSNRHSSNGDETMWALRDISFEVKLGEIVGIIGRNGAGKSTLLKILSRITEPTAGFVETGGRVGSLLEVGTGFHPELTGRENVYLNGAILGMKKADIESKFDEIVSFAEVERFIDTPVKHYSSGMYLRLAFAVAAHLDPDILIVDEVLAVGDAAFQKKCLGKMGDVAKRGKTVLFVSHQIAAVQSLCGRCLVLDNGMQKFCGNVSDAIVLYTHSLNSLANCDMALRLDRAGQGKIRFRAVSFKDANGVEVSSIPMGACLRIWLHFECAITVTRPQVSIAFNTSLGQRLFRLFTYDQAVQLPDIDSDGAVVCEIPSIPLLPDIYLVSVSIADGSGTVQDNVDGATLLEVLPADVFGTGRVPKGAGDMIFVQSRWIAPYAS